jgi:group I intron endonuclease
MQHSLNEAPTDCGIYLIECARTKQKYVGQSLHIKSRWSGHRRHLRDGTHHNYRLQRLWKEYGQAAFAFSVLECCPPSDLGAREWYWAKTLGASLNIAPTDPSRWHFQPERQPKMTEEEFWEWFDRGILQSDDVMDNFHRVDVDVNNMEVRS